MQFDCLFKELCIGVVNSGKQLADLEEELKQLRQKWKNCQRLEADRGKNLETIFDTISALKPSRDGYESCMGYLVEQQMTLS